MSGAGHASDAAAVLSGRVVLVVGAAGGLGSAVARACTAAGATAILLGRRLPALNRLHDELARSGRSPGIYPLDLQGATPADYDEMVARIEAEFGRLDGVVFAQAEFPGLTPLELTEPEAFARAIHVNLTAPFLLAQACLPLLRRAADAALVFVTDAGERVGRAYWGGYGVAKHGVAGLVAVLADELAGTPVRVCALEPGPMRTALRGRARFGENPARSPPPDAYAPAVVELLSAAGAAHHGRIWRPPPVREAG